MVTVFLGGFTEAIIHAGPGNAIVLATTSPFWVVVWGGSFSASGRRSRRWPASCSGSPGSC